MGKQPYIPLYIGDWEQDTNCLSLEAEGAWLKVVFKCWKNAGTFAATEDAFARLCKVDVKKFASILLEWQQNKICDITAAPDGLLTITSRRLKREAQISAKRSDSGSKGGSKTQANSKAKTKQNPEYEIEYENEVESENEKEDQVEKPIEVLSKIVAMQTHSEPLPGALVWDDEMYREKLLRLARSHGITYDLKNLLDRWEGWYVNKFAWENKTLQEMRLSFESWIKDPKSKINNDTVTKAATKQQRNTSSLVAGFAARHGSDADQ
jgi:uncharacterized protein YdaU (DUF1376 family)